MNKLLSFLFILSSLVLPAQVIDNTTSFRMVNADNYVRLHYDNDYFSQSDAYYTQGVNLEWVAPTFKKNPINTILLLPKQGIYEYGLALEHNAYTPTSIGADQILYGNRPYSADAMIKAFASSTHPSKHLRFTSSVSLGIIGKAAGAYEIQKAIHKWIGDTSPRGWKYQIKEDVIINYEAGLEKNAIHKHWMVVNYQVSARAGTLSNKLSAGGTLMIGKLNAAISSAFSDLPPLPRQKFTFHFYAQPIINAVVYDATLQGGLVFNRYSPYTISHEEMERLTFQGNAGIVFNIGSTYLEYFQSMISKEFETAHTHHWGGVRLGLLF